MSKGSRAVGWAKRVLTELGELVGEEEVKAAVKIAAKRPAAPAIIKRAAGAEARAAKSAKYDVEALRHRYPTVTPPELKVDKKSGKEYLARSQNPESVAVSKARKAISDDMAANGYVPFFDLAQRYNVDPINYPLSGQSLVDTLLKTPAKRAEKEALYDTPDVRARLQRAYAAGEDDPLAHDWYHMGQLENAYTDVLGPEAGRAAFKRRFADSMSATTGGADPTTNFLMSHYGNFVDQAGGRVPEQSYDLPFPIGGRFAAANLGQFDRFVARGEPILAGDNPKRHNFAANFMGHDEPATLDEQMSGIIEPGAQRPPPGTYGTWEGIVADVARSLDRKPRNFQEVAWKGQKGVPGKPMISHINDAIERTSRLLGIDPELVVELGLVQAKMPVYAEGGLV